MEKSEMKKSKCNCNKNVEKEFKGYFDPPDFECVSVRTESNIKQK